ncbi:MAG TPA: hypothetical protein VK427_12275 [Kofleriaceae bacterium]|nr:hypothetical protein [Kofleriaceae bacterium]
MRSVVWCVAVFVMACGGDSGGDDSSDDDFALVAPDSPDAVVAYREGNVGPWTVLQGTAGKYTLPTEPSGRFTIAVMCALDSAPRVDLYELRPGDVGELLHTQPCRSTGATISGSLTNVAPGARTYGLFAGSARQSDGAYTVDARAGGDVVAAHNTPDSMALATLSDRVVIRRNVTGPVDLDLAAPDAVTTQRFSVGAIISLTSGFGRGRSELITANGTRATLSDAIHLATGGIEVTTLPASALAPGELQLVTTFVMPSSTDVVPMVQIEERAARELTRIQPALAKEPGARPVVGWDGFAPYVLVRAYWKPKAADVYRVVFEAGSVSWTITTTHPSFDDEGGASWVVPDLSGVPGWNPMLGFRLLVNVGYTATARAGAPLAQLVQLRPTIETTIQSVGYSGTIRPSP